MMTATPLDAFRQAIEQAGLTAPDEIVPDGRLHRFASNGDRADDAGWYVLYSDGLPAGSFGDWRSGLKQNWCAKSARQMSATERAEQRTRLERTRQQREADERLRHVDAAQRAQVIWSRAAPETGQHLYLQKKGIGPHGLRVVRGRGDDGDVLIVPVTIDATMASLQFIYDDGEKRFLRNGAVKGGSYTIGDLTTATTILLCEGFATGASLYEAAGLPVVVAFSANNLTPVAEDLRQQFPTAMILVCGDKDLRDDGTPDVGLDAATAATEAIGGVLVMPELDGRKCDWNDVYVQRGLDAVKEAIEAAIRQEESTTMESGHILDAVHAFLGRFVSYPSEHARVAHCLWVAHTHLMDKWESTPRIAFISPEPSSGKTRALELTETCVPRPVESVNATSAYLFRKISDPEGLPTILYDEIDTIFGPRAKEHEDIRGVINAGHRRGASAGRCVVKGKLIETEELPAFCAVAMAGLGHLPETIMTRCVIILMRRRAPGEVLEPYRRRMHAPEGNRLRDRLAAWAVQIRATLDTYPAMPDGITDRNADVWESLLSVADAAGGSWPDRARVAAVALVAAAKGDRHSLGIRLLGDLRTVFGDRNSMWTTEILAALIDLEESPWGDLKGKPLAAKRLSDFLKRYEVTSKQVRIGEVNQRGYTRESLWDAWARYLPPKGGDSPGSLGQSPLVTDTAATSATSKTPGEESLYANDQTEVIDLAD